MPRNRLPRVMKHYSPTGRRNYGRPLKKLLDTWNRKGSTSGPTPWHVYDDDDDDCELVTCVSVWCQSIQITKNLFYTVSQQPSQKERIIRGGFRSKVTWPCIAVNAVSDVPKENINFISLGPMFKAASNPRMHESQVTQLSDISKTPL
jgi:hypothetical protein